MKLVCVNCQTQLRIKKNGVLTVDMFNEPPEPYEAYYADMWECPGCAMQIVAGFGQQPTAVHYEVELMKRTLDLAQRTGSRVDNYKRPKGRIPVGAE